ncbi:MAG: DNA recombination protein RmuC [Alphaproteobacteria bacterium]|nr:DNA recombination protein RmuC [Alphaproteobacteria bacterium]
MEWVGLILALVVGLGGGIVIASILRRTDGDDDARAQMLTLVDTMRNEQSQLAGRLGALAESQERTQGEFARTMTEQLGQVSKNMTDNLTESREKTAKSLGDLGERLSLIDKAQQEITTLSSQVVELQHILDNKQARGAFGEAQLNDIVTDGLPESAYAFQYTLSNGKRADCLIRLPNPPGPVVVDSKFPLEAYQKLRTAEDDAETRAALTQMKTDTLKHATDIAGKYIISGETADAALMFLPSESIFSELHLRLPDVVEKCRALRVYPVSPNTMSLTLNTVRAIMRDVKMRQQAGLIQKEVENLLVDVTRLDERIGKLRSHFNLAGKDIEQIETSSRKINSRGEKITSLEVEADSNPDLLED